MCEIPHNNAMTDRMARPGAATGKRILIALLVVALGSAAVLALDRAMHVWALEQAGASANNDAQILAAGLQSELDKFSLVPLVLAQDPQVQSLLSGRTEANSALNRRLEGLARQTDASAIYLMDRDGLTLAASNWRMPESFVGSRYNFRTYFKTALREGSATQFALGTVSRQPGLYIAQRVGPPDDPEGIVAVKVEFSALESSWRAATGGVFVTDSDGVVLIASNDNWRFKLAEAGAAQKRNAEENLQQFGVAALQPLDLGGGSAGRNLVAAPLLDAEQPIALDGWVLHLLVDPSPTVKAAVANGRLILLFSALIVGLSIGWLVYVRRQREAAASAEIAARTRTLREQLTQANRLATLGQVSAGVAHEINQPLAAMQIFAENGAKLLLSGKTDAASENFTQIVGLADRIGRITNELRRFSRKQNPAPRAMMIGEAIEGALLLLHDRIATSGVTLVRPFPDDLTIEVRAEHVRLEQVLVNLLQNALDATGSGGTIHLAVSHSDTFCMLTVSDDGAGISPDVAESLFQPFATSKDDGLGLGLVISQDIMRELGGDLVLDASVTGAQFTMRIPRT